MTDPSNELKQTKRCKRCHVRKPLDTFAKTKFTSSPDGHRETCNPCWGKLILAGKEKKAAERKLEAKVGKPAKVTRRKKRRKGTRRKAPTNGVSDLNLKAPPTPIQKLDEEVKRANKALKQTKEQRAFGREISRLIQEAVTRMMRDLHLGEDIEIESLDVKGTSCTVTYRKTETIQL